MADILADLVDLHKQATTEKSHYYVAACCKRAILEITRLREVNRDLKFVIDNKGKTT